MTPDDPARRGFHNGHPYLRMAAQKNPPTQEAQVTPDDPALAQLARTNCPTCNGAGHIIRTGGVDENDVGFTYKKPRKFPCLECARVTELLREVAARAAQAQAERGRTDAYYLAMAALDMYPILDDGLPKSTSVVFRIHQLGHEVERLRAAVPTPGGEQ